MSLLNMHLKINKFMIIYLMMLWSLQFLSLINFCQCLSL